MQLSPVARTSGQEYDFRLRYETFRALLEKNIGSLVIMSDLEADLNHMAPSDKRLKRPVKRLFEETLLMAQELNILAQNRYRDLYPVLDNIREKTVSVFETPPDYADGPLAVNLADEGALSVSLSGGKAYGVATLMRHFPELVPPGFVITTSAYRLFLAENGLEDKIRLLLHDMASVGDREKLLERINTIRRWILGAKVPEKIRRTVLENVSKISGGRNLQWAVRSSAVNEDGRYTFAGQFDSELCIAPENIEAACREVLAGRFSERAVLYRLHVGIKEVDTPMAILLMPMVDPVAAGVIYTADPREPESDKMVLNVVPGLGDRLLKGKVKADTFILSREPSPNILEAVPAEKSAISPYRPGYFPEPMIKNLGALAMKAAESFGCDLDIEWAFDRDNRFHLLQARRISPIQKEAVKSTKGKKAWPVIEGGVTIFPGRAVGEVFYLREKTDPATVPKGVVLVAREPGPEISAALPRIAALVAEHGNPVGHVATLVREFGVPTIFRMKDASARLSEGRTVSVNATNRTVFDGSRWAGIRERVLARVAGQGKSQRSGPLHDLVIALNLTDPDDSSFKAKSCRSIHDTLRFMHEMAVRTLFSFGDEQKGGIIKKSPTLKTSLPVRFHLISLDGCLPQGVKHVEPENVESAPFQALWRGVSDANLAWPERWQKAMRGMPGDFQETVLGGNKGPRRAKDANYAIVARDYLNVNARFAYHYALVDAITGPGAENNHVHFRLRGGGGSDENRARRTRFLEIVLRSSGFGVDRRGDIITAWLRRHPGPDSEKALEMLGRLIVCARQLDAVLNQDSDARRYAEYFLEGRFKNFL